MPCAWKGTGTGTFDLDVFYGDARRDLAYRQAYAGVPVVPGTVAEVAVQVADRLPCTWMRNGDGAFDQDVSPARTFEVAVVEPGRRQTPWVILISGVALTITGIVLLIVFIRHWRKRGRAPAPPVSPASPPGQPQVPAGLPAGTASQACARCGQVGRPGARFCPKCGAPLPAALPPVLTVCPRCGAIAQRPGARYCQKCGGPL